MKYKVLVRRVCSCCHGYSLLPGSDTQLYGVGCYKFVMEHSLPTCESCNQTILLFFDMWDCSGNMRRYTVFKKYFVRRLVWEFSGTMAQGKVTCSKIISSHDR